MRRLCKSKKEGRHELTPWPLPNQSNRSEFDESHFRSITLLEPHNQLPKHACSLESHNINQSIIHSKSLIGKDRITSLHGKTLSNFKDYYKKYYTEEAEEFLQKSQLLTSKVPREKNLKVLSSLHKQISYKKTSIIDLTRSLNENIIQNKSKTMIMHKDHSNKEHAYNRILKLKQEMIRNKQRRKIDKRQLEIKEDELRPESRSLPMRVKSPKKSNKTLFPDKNFGNLLCEFLEKV